jgi:hypothetical protein
MSNVSPGKYDVKDIGHKNPQWSMGARIAYKDYKVGVSPNRYDIPSKVIESPGKSFGIKLKEMKGSNAPGPGEYTSEFPKINNLKYSMGVKLRHSNSTQNVPGPGTYDSNTRHLVGSLSTKFGTGARTKLEKNGNFPGPMDHSPNYRAVKDSSP